ncbi:unnamed protein product, partial [Effrenium voratum]
EFGSGSGEMLSIAEEPKEAVNPFADEDPFQDIEPEEAPVAARPTAVSFAPPRRGSSGLRNPFDDDASSQASEDLPAGHIASGGGSFGRASGGILPLPEMPEESVREAGLEAAEEVRSLRRALISEEAACAQAKAELEAQLQAAEASEAGSLRRRLAEEKAKSRALEAAGGDRGGWADGCGVCVPREGGGPHRQGHRRHLPGGPAPVEAGPSAAHGGALCSLAAAAASAGAGAGAARAEAGVAEVDSAPDSGRTRCCPEC